MRREQLGLDFERTSKSQLQFNQELVQKARVTLPQIGILGSNRPHQEIIERQSRERANRLTLKKRISRSAILDLLQSIDLKNEKKGREAIGRYQQDIHSFIMAECDGSHALFDSSWNALLSDPDFIELMTPLFEAMYAPPQIGKSIMFEESAISSDDRSEKVILENKQLFSPQNYTQFIIMIRHAKAMLDSKIFKVGCRTPNQSHPNGRNSTMELIANLDIAMKTIRPVMTEIGIDITDPRFYISQSPNTRELAGLVANNIQMIGRDVNIQTASLCESGDFGFTTGQFKQWVHSPDHQADVKNPLYRFSGGGSFADMFLNYADEMHTMSLSPGPRLSFMCTHSSTMQVHAVLNHMMQSAQRSLSQFMSAAAKYNSYKENQTTALIIGMDNGVMSDYRSFVGTSELESHLV